MNCYAASLRGSSFRQIVRSSCGRNQNSPRFLSFDTAGQPKPAGSHTLRTLNPHMIVTSTTRTGDSPAHQSYLTRALRPAGTTPALCRQTRVSQLVTDLDPKLAAAALGMQDSGLV